MLSSLPVLASAKTHLAVLGVFAPFPPELLRRFPEDIGRLLSADSQLVVYDLRKTHGRDLDSLGGREGDWNREWLNTLHGGSLQKGLSVVCREGSGLLHCRLNILALGRNGTDKVDSLLFHGEAKIDPASLPREWADGFLRMESQIPQGAEFSQGARFSPPLSPAMLVKGKRIIHRDSVPNFPPGTRLIRGEWGEITEMKVGDQRYFLYPKSAYSLPSPQNLVLDSGSLALAGGGDSVFLVSPSLRAVGKAKLASLTHEGKISVLRLFRGNLKVSPLLGSQSSYQLREMESFSTRGYAGERRLLSLEEERRVRRDLEAFLEGPVLSQLLAPSAALREKLFYVENRIGSADPELVEFIGSDMGRFGIRSGIPTLEGEIWRHEDKPLDAALREAGCYLCSPDRVGN